MKQSRVALISIFILTILNSEETRSEELFGQLLSSSVPALSENRSSKNDNKVGFLAAAKDIAIEQIENPIPEQVVKICISEDKCTESITNHLGIFRFTDLNAGIYDIYTTGPEGIPLTGKLVLQPGESKGVRLITPAPHSLLTNIFNLVGER